MKIVLNIGLNVGNSEPHNQLEATLDIVTQLLITTNIKVAEGTYEGVKERTLVIEGTTATGNYPYWERIVAGVAGKLKQECISCTMDGKGYLVYARDFEGEKAEFNEKYFLTF